MGKADMDILVAEVGRSENNRDARTGNWEAVLYALSQVDRARFIPEGVYITRFIVAEEGVSAVHALAGLLKAAEESRTPANRDVAVRLERIVLGVMSEARKIVVSSKSLAYADVPLDIGYGQTCSQPYVVAFMADQLELSPGLSVLEVGAGCGYSAAVTAHLVGESGRLVSVECILELAEIAAGNLSRHFRQDIGVRSAESLTPDDLNAWLLVVRGDGSNGISGLAPYDRIYVTADVSHDYHFDPDVLAGQLRDGCGIVLYPRETTLVKKTYVNGALAGRNMFASFAFVPLVRG